MAFLFKAKQKTPQELVKSTKEPIQRLNEILGQNRTLSAALASQNVTSNVGSPTNTSSSAGSQGGGYLASAVQANSGSSFPVDKKLLEKVFIVRKKLKVFCSCVDIGRDFEKSGCDENNFIWGRRWVFIYASEFYFTVFSIDAEPIPELVSQLSQEVYQNDLLQLLVQNMAKLEFEVTFEALPYFLDDNYMYLQLLGKERCRSDI